jgi:hypothetical protein
MGAMAGLCGEHRIETTIHNLGPAEGASIQAKNEQSINFMRKIRRFSRFSMWLFNSARDDQIRCNLLTTLILVWLPGMPPGISTGFSTADRPSGRTKG